MGSRDHGITERFGYHVRRWRLEAGITQEALADAVGLTRTSIVNIERGRQAVSVDRLPAFAVALNVQVTDLFDPLPTVCPLCNQNLPDQEGDHGTT